MGDGRIKVLYIAGRGRSGSTLLERLLGQIEGFFSVGELRLWNRRLREGRRCGCGAPLGKCEIWNSALGKAFGNLDRIDDAKLDLHEWGAHSRTALLMLLSRDYAEFEPCVVAYLAQLERIYHAVQSTTGCKVIVDSSKSPVYVHGLGMLPSIDLYMVHLVRDPRAVAYSWLRQQRRPKIDDPLSNRVFGPVKSSLFWSATNLLTEIAKAQFRDNFLLLRYEDFIRKPEESMKRILTLVGEESRDFDFMTRNRVQLGINHTVSGNPNRFRTGAIHLLLDEDWRISMKASDKRCVSLLTWPLCLKYGYFGR
jgi:hypothetical protein